jgi:indoleamine 2,3-dioxygenase
MPELDASALQGERVLRRAHHVLAWLLHFFVHTLPASAPVLVPRPLARPLLDVCAVLELPPVLTYSDDVLYNWAPALGAPPGVPDPDTIGVQTTFTGTRDEAEFYLASARIELRGVAALSLMSSIADEAFIGDAVAVARIAASLHALSGVIDSLAETLLAVRAGCDPEVFYHAIRPWFKGEDAAPGGRRWAFAGATPADARALRELSGPSAGQSALVHALDVFLGVAPATHGAGLAAPTSATPFLERMQAYMPRHHRAFLAHLARAPAPLRALVQREPRLVEPYDAAVGALKRFRDAHMRVVALYIIGPARRAAAREAEERGRWLPEGELKGTGGTELVQFLKGVRDRTEGALLGGA